MRILVTGATGYIGSKISEELRRTGDYDVVCSHRTHCADGSQRDGTPAIYLDVTDARSVRYAVNFIGPNVIVNAAALVGDVECAANPKLALDTNVIGTRNLVEAANSVEAHIIHISTAATEFNRTLYEKTQRASDEIVMKESKLSHLILKPSMVFGLSPNVDAGVASDHSPQKAFNRMLLNMGRCERYECDVGWRFRPTWLNHIPEIIIAAINQGITSAVVPVTVETPAEDGTKKGRLVSEYDIASDMMQYFGKEGLPIPKKLSENPELEAGTTILSLMSLPTHRYTEMVNATVHEMKLLRTAQKSGSTA